MQLTLKEIKIPGCYEIAPKVIEDDRGIFIKTYHQEAFRTINLCTDWQEEYYSVSRHGVLRGLHFQTPPQDHNKLVYCSEGNIVDAVLDLRQGSPTFGRHFLVELCAEKRNMLYIPKGLAHGFYVTSDRATMHYKVSSLYAPKHDMGIRWDSAGISWPDRNPSISPRDLSFPLLKDFKSPFHFAENR